MRQVKWLALLAVLCLVPQLAVAQERSERRVSRLMDELRDEMWDYRRELEFFQRAPEYERLLDLRYQLRSQAMRMAEFEERGGDARRGMRETAREMEETARELKRLTGRLEERTDAGAAEEVRRHADRLKGRADRIRELVGRLDDLLR